MAIYTCKDAARELGLDWRTVIKLADRAGVSLRKDSVGRYTFSGRELSRMRKRRAEELAGEAWMPTPGGAPPKRCPDTITLTCVVCGRPFKRTWQASRFNRAGRRPYCPEGDRYCGVRVWELGLDAYERVI